MRKKYKHVYQRCLFLTWNFKKMLAKRALNKIPISFCPWKNNPLRMLCDRRKPPASKPPGNLEPNPTLGDIGSKYQVFRDEDSKIILDVHEERLKYARMLEAGELDVPDPFDGLNLERGTTGVFDVEDLVAVLKRENAENLFLAAVPPEYKYVNHICVVSGKSHRHMLAIAQFVRRVFKQKRNSNDAIPRLEGADSKDWIALDLGNIALHIFSPHARNVYDLDSLWSVGPVFDKKCTEEDPVVQMLEKHSVYLKDLQPAN